MSTRLFSLAMLLLVFTTTSGQGIAIGNGTPVPDASAMLDIQSEQKGLLVPRMTQAQRNAIVSPAPGLLVYQTDISPGFYYNSGSAGAPVWTSLQGANGWATSGNAGTNPATQFIGTSDATDLNIRSNNIGRMVVKSDGQVLIGSNTGNFFDNQLEVFGFGYPGSTSNQANAIAAYSSGNFTSVYALNTGNGDAIFAQNNSNGTAVHGFNSNSGTAVMGTAIFGHGVAGQSQSPLSGAIFGKNRDPAGIGVIGLGNDVLSFFNPGTGSGVLGHGTTFGVIGYAGQTGGTVQTEKWGGYFEYRPGANTWAYIGGRTVGTDYAILSPGVKSTMVKDEQGQNRIMYCPEAPEVLFQDVGTGQLENGRAHIKIDPLLARNIYVSPSKPLKVFIQLEGDCKGVYVTNKSASGFDVIELQGGMSNTPFTYQIIANRANETDAAGRVTSRFADNRFPVGPGRPGENNLQAQDVPVKNADMTSRMQQHNK